MAFEIYKGVCILLFGQSMKNFLLLLWAFYNSCWVVAFEKDCDINDIEGLWHCSREEGLLRLTYDCLMNDNKTLELQLWSTKFPKEMQSLQIQNCEKLVLDSNCSASHQSFRYLHVLNISELIVGEKEYQKYLTLPEKNPKSTGRSWKSKVNYNNGDLILLGSYRRPGRPDRTRPRNLFSDDYGEEYAIPTLRLPSHVIFENIGMAAFQTPLISDHLEPCGFKNLTLESFKLINVLALVSMPSLLDDPSFPEDVKARARTLLNECRGYSIGSYTDSLGIEAIRKLAAKYIEKRDGIPSNYGDLFLSAGASDGIKNVLKLLNECSNGKRPGVMAPIPQYPLYLAALTEFNMHQIGYYLDESKNWALSIQELEKAIEEAKKYSDPKAIVVINPGNPTSQVLTKENIEEIIKFACKERLFIFADEVYQHNIYAPGSKFYSFKKVMTEMGSPYKDMKLASFMSISKGYMGECGLRGGFAEVINLSQEEKKRLLISVSALLCPTALGQVATACIASPPEPGEPSYDLYSKEKEGVLSELKKRAKMVTDALNSIPRVSCNEIQGALYAFARIDLPPKAIEAAEKEGRTPDEFYSLQLLEKTGICVVPGTGFGQQPGTHHFRITILPQLDILKEMLETLRKFHEKFLEEYS